MLVIAKKAGRLVLTLLVVSLATFLLTNLLPGDPARTLLGLYATPEGIAALREQLRLDDPLWVRFGSWLFAAVQGDLGVSYINGRVVATTLLERLPLSIGLMLYAQVIALLIAIPVGIVSGYRQGRPVDRVLSTAMFGSMALPSFVLAVVLVFVFAIQLRWLPATGYVPLAQDPLGSLRSLFLPALTLAISQVGLYARVLRSDLITTLQDDFILTARSKGLTDRSILLRHAFKPSSLSLVTVAGLNVAQLIGGALIIESIFVLPGIGSLLVGAINARDYAMVQGGVLLLATLFVVVNFLVDLAYTGLDPRIRTARRG